MPGNWRKMKAFTGRRRLLQKEEGVYRHYNPGQSSIHCKNCLYTGGVIIFMHIFIIYEGKKWSYIKSFSKILTGNHVLKTYFVFKFGLSDTIDYK